MQKEMHDSGKKPHVEIRGNTLRVYLYLLKNGQCELRDIQHSLGMSSPSLVLYHLGKLTQSGCAEQDQSGRYLAVRDAVGEVLEGYSKLGSAIVPRVFFYSVLFSILIGYFSFEAISSPEFSPYYLVAASLGAVATLWLETLRLWRNLAP
jgi:hypothetical protein